MIELHPIEAIALIGLALVLLFIVVSTHFKLERIVKYYFEAAESNSRARMNQVKEHLDKKVHSTEGQVSTDLHRKVESLENHVQDRQTDIYQHMQEMREDLEARIEKLEGKK